MAELEVLLTEEPRLSPVGACEDYAGTSDPNNRWMILDGRVLEQALYPQLYTVVGAIYNTGGETATQFRIPDARGRTIVAAGSGTNLTTRIIGEKVGAETHVLTTSQIPSHSHTGSIGNTNPNLNHSHQFSGDTNSLTPNTGGGVRVTALVGGNSGGTVRSTTSENIDGTHNHSLTINDSGGGSFHNNMQPSLVLNKIMRVL